MSQHGYALKETVVVFVWFGWAFLGSRRMVSLREAQGALAVGDPKI